MDVTLENLTNECRRCKGGNTQSLRQKDGEDNIPIVVNAVCSKVKGRVF